MRSFTLHFSAWLTAAACILAIEIWFDHAYHPSFADRSNFTPYGLETHFVPDQMEQILYQKIRMNTVPNPDIVQVGDSSGFFGIIPEVVEKYLPGMKYLNESCCGTQGFNGYLALLRYNLRRFPSIKYMVVYSGILGVYPGHVQWRNAPKNLSLGPGGATLATLGEKMETNLVPPWSWFSLPTNSLRKSVLQTTFLSNAVENYVNAPTGVWEAIINGLQTRQGYGLEADHQNVGEYGADSPPCWTLKYETFFDWKSLRMKSYVDAFVEEYVALAREFNVVPIWAFQISSCRDTGSADVAAMRENLKRLQQRFPELKVPFNIIDPYPENDFSVTVHVLRDVTQDISQRLGIALREIVGVDHKIKIEPAPANSTLSIKRATRVDTCDHQADITEIFGGQCNGNGACDIDLGRWRQLPDKNSCKATYIAEFNCSDGPVRIVRQETEDRFGGRFRLDCRLHDRWARDDVPRGILVADSTFAGLGGNPMGLVTLRTKAYCDGLLACDYAIKPQDPKVQAGEFTVRWYCGSKEKTLTLANATAGTRAHLACP